jgi:hypothetical protein
VAGDDRDRLGVACGGLGVLAVKVAVFAEAGAEPGVFQVAGAGHGPQLGQGDVRHDLGVGAGPVRGEAGPEQQFAAFLEGVVEPLGLGAAVFRAAFLAEGFQDRADRGGALGGQVAADEGGAAERHSDPQAPLAEPGLVLVLVGLLPAVLLDRGRRDDRQVLKRSAGPGRLRDDLIGRGAHLTGQLAGPLGDLVRLRLGQHRAGHRGLQVRALAQAPHLPDLRSCRLPGQARLRHQPRRRRPVPVSLVPLDRAEAPQHPHPGPGQLRLEPSQRD